MKKDLAQNFELPKKSQIAKTNTPSDTLKKPSINENAVRVTMDIPGDLHTEILLHLIKTKEQYKKKKSIKDFFIDLAKKELK